jgi:hypothetical protein
MFRLKQAPPRRDLAERVEPVDRLGALVGDRRHHREVRISEY